MVKLSPHRNLGGLIMPEHFVFKSLINNLWEVVSQDNSQSQDSVLIKKEIKGNTQIIELADQMIHFNVFILCGYMCYIHCIY